MKFDIIELMRGIKEQMPYGSNNEPYRNYIHLLIYFLHRELYGKNHDMAYNIIFGKQIQERNRKEFCERAQIHPELNTPEFLEQIKDLHPNEQWAITKAKMIELGLIT